MPVFGNGTGSRGNTLVTNFVPPKRGQPQPFAVVAVTASTVGTIAFTEDNDTAVAAGTVGENGTIAYTEGNDTAAFTGTFTPPAITGTISFTEGNDTAALAGSVGVNGSATIVEAGDTAVLTGSIGVAGVVAVVEGGDSASFSGSGGDSASPGGSEIYQPTPRRPLPWLFEPEDIRGRCHITEGNDTANLIVAFDITPVDDDELLLVLT